ncbi:putative zinc finger motif, c2HC5-type domain-containing protein [Ditylenchus destructor]|uniref:Zinc finger motif, c2HC5-type domain-containing protein n=1 Tax=Ditylenchus destructor TaxID=166010 RepID=A0AAD4RCM4_9BILA|nr:putative zinc finger motif, c2HC5-type domain-containing protein [Ditylenchus destructor]
MKFLTVVFQSSLVYSRFIEDREVVCSSDKMVINLSFKQPFSGVVFIQNQFARSECRWRGNGSHFLLVVVPLSSATRDFCGIELDSKTGENSATLVISPDSTIITEDAFALTVRCMRSESDLILTLGAPSLDPSFRILRTQSMTIFGNSGTAPSLTLRVLDGHGIIGSNVSEAVVGQRLTLDAQLKDTSIYDVFVHDCIAHDGSHNPDATITIMNSNGCAVRLPRVVDAPVLLSSPQRNAAKHVYVHMYGFQFTSSEFVHFECQVTPCIHSCDTKQCQEEPSVVKTNPSSKLSAYVVKAVIQIVSQRSTTYATAMAQALHMERQSSIIEVPMNEAESTCRHPCDCQARIHSLVRNCLNCGRIVCAQEGSGPCFYCGNLVCTREERQILAENSKRSLELLKALTRDDTFAQKITDPSNSFAKLGNSILQATDYKEKLLEADKSRDRTKVHDLESDYYNLENNVFLSPEDRQAIIKRKDELRQLNLQNSRKIVLDLDFANKSVTEKRQKTSVETVNDPILQSIVLNSKQNYLAPTSDELPEQADFVKDFVPLYRQELSEKREIDSAVVEILKNITDKSGVNTVYCISLHQPLASLYAKGAKRHLPCAQEIKHKGTVFINTLDESEKAELFIEQLVLENGDADLQSSSPSILGRGIIVDCVTWAEYLEQFSDGECSHVKECFVLLMDGLEELPFPVPYASPKDVDAELHKVDKHYRDLINKILVDGLAFESLNLNTI